MGIQWIHQGSRTLRLIDQVDLVPALRWSAGPSAARTWACLRLPGEPSSISPHESWISPDLPRYSCSSEYGQGSKAFTSGQGSGAAPKESSHVAADVTPLSAGLPLHLQLARLSESRLKQLLPTLLEVRAVIQRAVIQRAYLGPFQLRAAGLGPSNKSKGEVTSQRPLSALIPQCGLLRNPKLRAVL